MKEKTNINNTRQKEHTKKLEVIQVLNGNKSLIRVVPVRLQLLRLTLVLQTEVEPTEKRFV